MTEKLEIGDFARNTIHGYISLLYKEYPHANINSIIWTGWDALIVSVQDDWAIDFIKVGTLRNELCSELKKVPASLSLIIKAKEYLNQLNSVAVLDNLSYVEILHKLNAQEKALKNE